MKQLNDKERTKIIIMLIEQQPFSEIRKVLGVGKNFNLKELCEFNGRVLESAFKLHKNNIKKEVLPLVVPQDELVTKGDLLKLIETIKGTTTSSINNQIESTTHSSTSDDYIEINSIPNQLPNRLVGENYKVKTTSIKIIDNVWNEFKELSASSTHSSIEILSLALLEFIEKYKAK